MTEPKGNLWFEKKEGGLGLAPITWQGKFATILYIVLVLFAVVVYSSLSLIVTVLIIYTIIFAFIVIVKSDVLKDRLPPRD
jgi:hypothetical protein